MMGSEVVDFSLRIYQNLGWLILRLTLVPSVFIFGGLAFLFWIVIPKLGVTRDPSSVGAQVGEAVLTLAVALGVAIPIVMIGFSFSSTVIFKLVANFIEGSVPDSQGAIRTARQSLKSVLGLTIYESFVGFSGILASTGLLMLSAYIDSISAHNATSAGVVAAIGMFGYLVGFFVFLAVVSRHAIAGPAAIAEGLKAFAAARRSVQLLKSTKSHPSGYGSVWFAFFVIGFLSLILLPGFYFLLDIVDLRALIGNFSGWPTLGEALGQLLRMAPLFLFVWVSVPIWCATISILYFERRIRLEGYDIETLARDMVRNRKENRFEF